jgi:hypothetical protein
VQGVKWGGHKSNGRQMHVLQIARSYMIEFH